ncbi:MAG: DUF4136 domain-containing protein, partial [Chlorobiales bacterium]|nr:DUF4136 domain-containing protein [Chlorobiales bacterium]
MNRTFSLFSLLFISVLAPACSSVEVGQKYNPEVNFSSYKTFCWLSKNKMEASDPRTDSVIQRQILNALSRELSARGFALKAASEADFVVAFYVSVEQKLTGAAIDNLRDIPQYGYGTRDISGYQHYNEGTLIVDFIDPKKNELTWRGTAVGVVGDDAEEIRS